MSAAAAFLLAACSSSAPGESATPIDSIPFIADDSSIVDPDADLTEDIDDLSLDVVPATPLEQDVAAALAEAAQTDGASEQPSLVDLGTPVDDATHVGLTGVTVEALMRELSVAYGGKGELLGNVQRTEAGGTFSFSLTDATLANGSATQLVVVDFSYIEDPDEPSMIVGHRADSIVYSGYELTN